MYKSPVNPEDSATKEWMCKLLEVMERLRSKTDGCPWDIEQTHESIKPNLIEETYELIDAIESKNPENLREELGDLLLQVIFHSQMAKESHHFSFREVLEGLHDKLISRHPHVFSDKKVKTAKEALDQWQEIKRKEKPISSYSSMLSKIPKHLPALEKAQKLQSKVSKIGFDWQNHQGALDKFKEEISELEEAIQSQDVNSIKEETGDVFFSLINVCRFFHINAEDALQQTIKKFAQRFELVEMLAKKKEKDLSSMTINELEELWIQAKKSLRR